MDNALNRIDSSSVLAGVGIGLIGGAVGSFVMSNFQSLLHRAFSERSRGFRKDEETSTQSDIPANEKAARVIAEDVMHMEHMNYKERKRAGKLVHYAFGSSMGALYGGLASARSARPFGSGLAFGAGLWAIADETMVPLLRLSAPATKYPLKTHLYALSSHLVYGLTLDLVRTFAAQMVDRGVNLRAIPERVNAMATSVRAA